ncbi:hypothetical protein CkaCkLH20_02403 [Colletotrichum karsti]|uniref:DUF8035 domain-containing protein n=1 Tax=Colletotrichum karsti TaxID=1095194 RepID=A0A9P6IDH2_9PEZI|nr:uncharacterized protein CkaCkLH20_02403 [Colletotrichum karsti]KAF9880449.1 hypothetical protein CkaCkLH20_02403 [Colletotrichum karsti]
MAGRAERWDRDRFMYERERDRGYGDDRRGFDERSRFDERERERDDYYPPPRRGRDHSDERYDRGDRGYRGGYDDDFVRDRRHVEEDRYRPRRDEPLDREFDRRLHLERERERRSPSPVRRPTMVRRQSSLDTFDRRPLRFWERDREREEYPPPARREDIRREDFRAQPYVPIPLPRTRQLGPAPSQRYDEIQIAEPGYYGDEEYRDMPERVKEREVVRSRRRRDRSRESKVSRSTRSTRTKSHRSSSRSSSTSSRSTSTSGATTIRSEYPKKGKTRIPQRLVSKRALIDLGYPYIEEGNTVIVLKALGQDNIDELLKLSEEYKQSELEIAAARSSAGRIEERHEEIYTIPPPVAALPPPPPSVHERPPPPPVVIAPPSAPPTVYSAPPPPAPAPVVVEAPPPPPPVEEVVERRTVIREVSPARSYTTTTSGTTGTVYERREISEEIPIGPMAVAERRRSRSRSRKNIRSEIKALEAELHSRKHGHSRDLVHAEQMPDGAVVLYEEKVEKVEEPRRGVRIEKDKKGPPPKLMRAMLATLT